MELEDLPDEVLLEIFARLPTHDLVKCALHVCPRWRTLLLKSGPWKGKEYRTENPEEMGDVVELVRSLPHLRHICIGSLHSFHTWFTGSYVYISSGVDHGMLRHLIEGTNIDSIIIPKDLFTRDFALVLGVDRKPKSLIVSPSNHGPSNAEAVLQLLLQQRALTELRALHLFGAQTVTNDTVMELCQQSPHLEELALHDLNNLSDKGLQNLKMCPRLRLLELTHSASLENLSFLQNCPNLQHLDISMCWNLRGSVFQHLLHLKNLKRFHMRHTYVEGLPLKSMAEELKHLEMIDLLSSRSMSSRQLRELKMCAPRVTVLHGGFDFTRH